MPEVQINASRLNSSLEGLGRIGEALERMQRIAFSPADVTGREYAISLMRRAGLESRIDAAGNIIGRRAGSAPGLPAIVMDSRTDTVPSGAGHYAQAIAALTDMAMIFVPSINDISHSTQEYSTPQDCANGAQVLLELLLLADQRM
jgi:N-carbamoyl-L-amino-acid hydrolase